VSASDLNDPGNPENKHRTRESQRQLRGLLMEWDPIGVSEFPEAADEYDCMLSPLLHRLHDGVSEEEIRDWIVGEIQRHFEMQADQARESQLVSRIKDWWRVRVAESPGG